MGTTEPRIAFDSNVDSRDGVGSFGTWEFGTIWATCLRIIGRGGNSTDRYTYKAGSQWAPNDSRGIGPRQKIGSGCCRTAMTRRKIQKNTVHDWGRVVTEKGEQMAKKTGMMCSIKQTEIGPT